MVTRPGAASARDPTALRTEAIGDLARAALRDRTIVLVHRQLGKIRWTVYSLELAMLLLLWVLGVVAWLGRLDLTAAFTLLTPLLCLATIWSVAWSRGSKRARGLLQARGIEIGPGSRFVAYSLTREAMFRRLDSFDLLDYKARNQVKNWRLPLAGLTRTTLVLAVTLAFVGSNWGVWWWAGALDPWGSYVAFEQATLPSWGAAIATVVALNPIDPARVRAPPLQRTGARLASRPGIAPSYVYERGELLAKLDDRDPLEEA